MWYVFHWLFGEGDPANVILLVQGESPNSFFGLFQSLRANEGLDQCLCLNTILILAYDFLFGTQYAVHLKHHFQFRLPRRDVSLTFSFLPF